jgi:CheY-like chemotaxis protein
MAIVRNHGGFIHVYSEPGRGARFHVYLPAAVDGEAEEQGIQSEPLPRGDGEVILVVDDEDSIRRITRRTLEAFGYRVHTAADGADALAVFLQQKNVDVVFTDMMMPVMDGYALIVALRRFDPAVRIIGTSGVAAADRLARVSDHGVKHFLPKPYTAEALLKMLGQVLGKA